MIHFIKNQKFPKNLQETIALFIDLICYLRHKTCLKINNKIVVMDRIKTEPLHLNNDKKLIDEYFSLVIKKELNIDINVNNEYVVVQNVVSKKLILVRTFSDKIIENPSLYLFLSSLIQQINTRSLTKNQLVTCLEEK